MLATMRSTRLLPLLLLCSCSPTTDRSRLAVFVQDEDVAAVAPFLRYLPFQQSLEPSRDPRADALAGHGAGLNVGLVRDQSCAGCYRLEERDGRFAVHGGDVLGLQYGLAALLELHGFGFFHPWQTRAPGSLQLLPGAKVETETVSPDLAFRGLDLHTLHPTEAYFDFWEPSEDNLQGALRTLDFAVKNRGNYVQWKALDNIQSSVPAREAWLAHTRTIVAEAHLRGLQVGIGLQLFGGSNLQLAFDLLDEEQEPQAPRAVIRERLSVLTEAGFDVYNLSFGEFSASDPQRFVDRVNDVYAALQELQPGARLTATVHVGKDLTVGYQGNVENYYHLVQHADPAVTPWVHTVMFYNLFEDAGGAYEHNDFHEQRDFLRAQLSLGKPAAYYPESAYWVAFDNPVPVWLPLYLRTRHHDLAQLRALGPPRLDAHVLFSSGWEWGYWQTDAAVLRMNHHLPETFEDVLAELLRGYGEQGPAFAAAIARMADVQHEGLLVKRLAAYYAARDAAMDIGRTLGIFSQPERPEFSTVASWTPEARASFRSDVLEPLGAFATATEAARDALLALPLPADDRFVREAHDGARINALRARFVEAAWSAVLAHAAGDETAPLLSRMDALRTEAATVVSVRRSGMHDPRFRRLLATAPNNTLYDYGYLREANTLCFWQREAAQVRNLVEQAGLTVPGCVL